MLRDLHFLGNLVCNEAVDLQANSLKAQPTQPPNVLDLAINVRVWRNEYYVRCATERD